MGKIKIDLANGSQVEKPLVTAFKGANGDYLILDNETNGQMGYPIICISKINGTNVEKIIDQTEWNAVKDSLKSIISGTLPAFLAVPEQLSGNDDFYTQLTLPVASFDLLKKAYKAPEAAPAEEAPAPVPEAPAPEAPAAPQIETPEAQTIAAPQLEAPTIAQPAPVAEAPVAPAPADPIITAPIIGEAAPEVAPTPEASPTSNGDLQAIKDTFMKSCENMFEALVKQLENK